MISRELKIGILVGLTIATADKQAERERCYEQLHASWNISREELVDADVRDEIYSVLFGVTPAQLEEQMGAHLKRGRAPR